MKVSLEYHDIDKYVCLRCGVRSINGPHSNPDECIEALRALLGDRAFEESARISKAHRKDRAQAAQAGAEAIGPGPKAKGAGA
jgi:DNA-binding NarL/FixJ family response regulator